jgi:serine/threonine protein kinase
MSIHSEQDEVQKTFLAKTLKFIELLHPDERPRFGDRCPIGYVKINLLGRGGNSLVWACRSQMTDEIYAVKQFPKVNSKYDSAADREIEFSKALFKTIEPSDTINAEDLKNFPGLA